MSTPHTAPADFFQCTQGSGRRKEKGLLTLEEPLVIQVAGDADYAIMRTPGNDRELAVGFLMSEGMITSVDEIQLLMECPDGPGRIEIRTSGGKTVSTGRRNMMVNTSCGLCGKENIGLLIKDLKPLPEGLVVDEAVFYDVPAQVLQRQELFHATGATHAAALFDAAGRAGVVREDIGRHNALDKVIGNAVLNRLRLADYGVFLSGRISLEMILKAYRAGISIVAAVSAPTGTAVEVAQQAGLAVCGFLRSGEMSIYSHAERIRESTRAAFPAQ